MTEPIRLDLRDPHVRATAYGTYDNLRAQGPIAPAILTTGDADARDFSGTLGRPSFLITGYEDAVAALLDDRFSVDPRMAMTPEQVTQLPPIPEEFRPLNRNLLSVDPPDHTRLRKLVQPSFTARAIEARRPRIHAIAAELLDAAERAAGERGETAPHRRLELIDAYAYPLPITVISELLGVPKADRDAVRTRSEMLLQFTELTEEEALASVRDFTAYLRDLFAEKRRHPADDLVTELVLAEEDGDRLDEEELLSMVFILIVAGHVTTVNLIGNGVLALLTHSEQLARLKANPALAASAVEEILRFWGPVEMASPRFPREDVELAGTHIPRGRPLLPVLAAADRDPARFPRPDEFNVERAEAHRHIAFGKAVHACLGAPLAHVEGEVALTTLFARMPDLQLAEPAAAASLQASLFRGPDRLPLLF
jgi:cytochrome P450 PksS